MIDYKHRLHFDGIEIRIPRTLADCGNDEAIKDYIRENVKSHVHCQQLADGLIGEDKMGQQLHLIGQSRQDWVNINEDIIALTRASRMKEIRITALKAEIKDERDKKQST